MTYTSSLPSLSPGGSGWEPITGSRFNISIPRGEDSDPGFYVRFPEPNGRDNDPGFYVRFPEPDGRDNDPGFYVRFPEPDGRDIDPGGGISWPGRDIDPARFGDRWQPGYVPPDPARFGDRWQPGYVPPDPARFGDRWQPGYELSPWPIPIGRDVDPSAVSSVIGQTTKALGRIASPFPPLEL